MLDIESINRVYKEAAEKQWSYPYLFNSLKSIGIERYEVNVLTHEIKYVGGGTSLLGPKPQGADYKPLKAGPKYDEPALKLAIKRSQERAITYPQFLEEIAAAGIAFYRVDMGPRTVTYHGPGKDKLVEKVPETK